MAPSLSASGLRKTFTMHLRGGVGLPVIADAAFELHPGLCAVLGGPSGAGNSSIVMKDGRVVEHGLTDRLLDGPQAPHSQPAVSHILEV